jgi:23S rRNA pseudouridine2605 synthase
MRLPWIDWLIVSQIRYNTAPMEERLQKLLAQAGYGSRRACEDFVIAGRVRVNGQVATLGQKADLSVDKVTIDGKALPKAEALVYIALYKPRNVLSAAEGQDDRQTVRDLIPLEGHLYPVGRLDFDSEGLILMTNDGELTNKLTHPRFGHEKEYRVLIARRPDDRQMEAWRRGVVLDDGDKTAPAEVSFLSSAGKGAWIRVVMGEGKKRQIREVGRLLGLPVVKIIRLRIGALKLGNLKPRQWRHLTENEVMDLKGEKAPTMEKRIARGRSDRNDPGSNGRPASDRIKRNPKDRPKRPPADRPRTKERNSNERPATTGHPKRTPNDRTRTTGRTERGRSDRTRGTTKLRTPRR